MSSSPNPNPDPSPEEEEIACLAALAALNELTISMSNSLFPAFPSTMQLQGEVFVLRHNFIDEADATEFYEQAQRYPLMKLTDCMQKQAIELLKFRIMIDPEFNIMDRRQCHDWQTKLSVLQVAKLIIKYFCSRCTKGSGGRSFYPTTIAIVDRKSTRLNSSHS